VGTVADRVDIPEPGGEDSTAPPEAAGTEEEGRDGPERGETVRRSDRQEGEIGEPADRRGTEDREHRPERARERSGNHDDQVGKKDTDPDGCPIAREHARARQNVADREPGRKSCERAQSRECEQRGGESKPAEERPTTGGKGARNGERADPTDRKRRAPLGEKDAR
jgi:hypothetical protein